MSDADASRRDEATPRPVISDRDIVFVCLACSGELVVDLDGAGMMLPCPHCGEPLTIPEYKPELPAVPASPEPIFESLPAAAPAVSARRFDFSGLDPDQLERRMGELQHQLKENRSQDTEMRGHVNRATMELHRLQLKLKKLQERQTDIEAELAALSAFASRGTA